MKTIQSIAIFDVFKQAFNGGVFTKICILAVGAILSPKKRSISECLRVMGLAKESNYSSYYYSLNGAVWSGLKLAKLLLFLVISKLNKPESTSVTFVLDDTLVRRYGKRVSMRGRYHDAVRSRGPYKVITTGVRWLSLQIVCQWPWSQRQWTAPILTIPCPTEKVCQKEGMIFRSMEQRSCLILKLLRRWLPEHKIMVLADGGFISALFSKQAEQLAITLVMRARSNLCFFDPPPPPVPGKRGPKPKKGARQPNLKTRFEKNLLDFKEATLDWYKNSQKQVNIASGTALWYRDGVDPIAVRWFVITDPEGKFKPSYFIATHYEDFSAVQLAQSYQLRWNCEVTFQELRQNLGLETQRHWSRKAMQRITPLLFGLHTLVTLIATELPTVIPRFEAAWYCPDEHPNASFHDILAKVRLALWHEYLNYTDSANHPSSCSISKDKLDSLLQTLAFAT